MNPNAVLTTSILGGLTVLAKETKYGVGALAYANLTQARAACEQLRACGVKAWVRAMRPFFVVIDR